MKILLTGATGFIGLHTAKKLVEEGHEVFALVRSANNSRQLKSWGVRLIFGSLEKIREVHIPPVEGVIHLAGLIKAGSKQEYFQVNTEATRHLLKTLDSHHLKKFVFVSSLSARGPNRKKDDPQGLGPMSAYGKSKLKAEEIVCSYQNQFSVCIVRPPIVYGPGDLETFYFFKMFKWGFFPKIGNKDQYISFIYISDLVKILVQEVTKGALSVEGALPAPIIEPDDGSGGYSWGDFVSIAQEIYQKKIRQISIPLWAIYLYATFGEWFAKLRGKPFLLSREKYKEATQLFWTYPSYKPPYSGSISIKEGLILAKTWYEKEGWL